MDEFLLRLYARLEEAKSKRYINADILKIQKELRNLQLQAKIDPASLAKITEKIARVTKQDIVINHVKINTGELEKTKENIRKAIAFAVEGSLSGALDNIIQRENKIAQTSASVANSIVQDEKKKQQAYKATTDEVVYHAGIISKLNKAETNGRFYGSSRGTGYFGTGHYFVDANTKHELDSNSSYSKLPYTSVDISKYDNLFKANTDAVASELHNFLENLTRYTQGSDKFNTNELFAQFEKVFGNTIMDIKEFESRLDQLKNFMSNSNLEDRSDSVSTQFMKSLGYGGVDTRGTKYADTRYGVVIYDLKEESVLQANITDELQKQGQMLEKIDYSKGEVFDKDTDLRIQEQIDALERAKEIKSEFSNIFDSSELNQSEQELASVQSRITEINDIIANCQHEIDNADESAKRFVKEMKDLDFDVSDEEVADWKSRSQNSYKQRIEELSLERAELEKRIPVLEETRNREYQLAQAAYEQAQKNIEQRRLESQQANDSADTVVKAEERKQEVIKNTKDTYDRLEESMSIIKSGAGFVDFGDSEEAQKYFQKILQDEKAVITMTEKFGDTNELEGFIVNIKRASGEVESLRYNLDNEIGGFSLSDSRLNDAGAIKQVQQITDAISDYTQKFAEFKSTNNQILSGLTEPIADFQAKLDGLRTGTTTVSEVANSFRNLKAEAANVTQNFSAQLSSIDRAIREISVGEETIQGLNAELKKLREAPQEVQQELVRCEELLQKVKQEEATNGRTSDWSAAYREWEDCLDSIRAKLRTLKKEESAVASADQINATVEKLNRQLNANSRYSKEAKAAVQGWVNELNGGEIAVSRLRQINKEAGALHTRMQNLGQTGMTFFENVKAKLGSLSSYLSASMVLAQAFQAVRTGTQNVKKLDDSLLELSKVSDLSAKGLQDVTETAYELGEVVGKTGTQVLDAVTTFKRAGFDIDQSIDLAEDALKMTNVAEGIDDAAVSAQYLVSIMKGYRDTSNEFAEKILDSINEVSNTQAVDFDNLADGAQRLSAVAEQADVSFDQMLGTLTGGYEVLGNMEKTASGLITIFTRLRSIQLADEEEVESVAKLQKTFSDATNGIVNIVDQSTGQLRGAYDILDDLNKVWDTLDKNTQEGLAFAAGGKLCAA